MASPALPQPQGESSPETLAPHRVLFPNGSVIPIDGSYSPEQLHAAATEINKHLGPAGQPTPNNVYRSDETDADIAAREAQHPVLRDVMHGTGEALEDVWNAAVGIPSGIVHSLPPVALHDTVKQAIPAIRQYENARQNGKSVWDSLHAASDFVKQHDATQQALDARIAEFKSNPTQATSRSLLDAAALAASMFGGGETAPVEGAAAEVAPAAEGAEVPAVVAPKPAPSQLDAAASGYLRKIGADRVPTPQIEVEGMADTPATKIAGQATRVKGASSPVISQAEIDDLARIERDKLDKARIEASRPENILAKAKERLQIPKNAPSGTPAIGEAAAVKTRATSGYQYVKTEDPLTTTHEIKISDAKGKPAGSVSARADNSDPNNWLISGSESTQGAASGLTAYRKLLDAAQKHATETGEPTRVSGGGVQSPSAIRTWQKLAKQGFGVEYDKAGRPSVEFQPKAAATKLPAGIFDEVKGVTVSKTKPSVVPTMMEKLHGSVTRAMRPASIDVTDELNAHQ